MKSRMDVRGLKELATGLDQLKKSTQTGVLTRVLKKAAAPIESSAKRNAPVETGVLRDSIDTVVVRRNAGKAAYAQAMRDGASMDQAGAAARAANKAAAGRGASATVRVRATAPHAIFAEFGTINAPAQPFLGPALRGGQATALETIKADLATEITKTAARAAARAAKKGTKK
ncbi:HK97-gp10 family putative phage morphogenesis protein [Ancylobacter sp. SL191]|uniref:HK97-gp10 family putative phage morphogenesis protein n=1 Tax=Ancylobacter sp. SL191 TaxID=2995166 RepID=UPI00226E161A|nr:HK97-gp10 family putative phage morphogenesis protein [Ancylobacter sp. SL191]WAC25747.1 HK97 gp10 family phage protein [Ancylobacter sp. SL191]